MNPGFGGEKKSQHVKVELKVRNVLRCKDHKSLAFVGEERSVRGGVLKKR